MVQWLSARAMPGCLVGRALWVSARRPVQGKLGKADTWFIAAKSFMSLTQSMAERISLLLDPTSARSASTLGEGQGQRMVASRQHTCIRASKKIHSQHRRKFYLDAFPNWTHRCVDINLIMLWMLWLSSQQSAMYTLMVQNMCSTKPECSTPAKTTENRESSYKWKIPIAKRFRHATQRCSRIDEML